MINYVLLNGRTQSCPAKNQLLRVMRITGILLLIGSLHLSAASLSQTITIKVKQHPIKQLFEEIEKQTGYWVVYSDQIMKSADPITIEAKDMPLTTFLNQVLKPQALTYAIDGENILIMADGTSTSKVLKTVESKSVAIKVPQETVRGIVKDEQGRPLQGVTITVSGSSTMTTTLVNGEFQISLEGEGRSLIFTAVGFETQELALQGQSTVAVVLKATISDLDEVVVVGYGTQKRATLTGSVATTKGEDLAKSPTVNLSNSLAGQLPGVIASNRSGEPGRDNSAILIRGRSTTGNTDPLVVVDGIQGYSGWEMINSNDIESVSVLKDASAAIYGARAANGVILITTKRGSVGKPTINYSFNQGITQPTRIPEMASSALYAEFVNDRLIISGASPKYTEEEIQKFRDGSDPVNYPNTDWYSEVLKKFSLQSQHHLNLTGGTENVKYLVSGSFSNQDGIFKKGSTNFKTYTIRSNMDAKINEYINVGLDINGALDNGNYPAFSTSSLFSNLGMNLPTEPVYWPNGYPSSGIEHGNNPAVMATDATGNNNLKEQRFNAKASFDIEIPWVQGLGVDGYFTYINNTNLGKNWQTPWETYSYNKATDAYTMILGGGILLPQLTESISNGKSTLINLRAKYEKQIADHHINAFVAVEQSEDVSKEFSAFRKDYMSDALDELFAGSLTGMTANGSASESGRKNVFGRISYGFQEKYLLDFNFRYDGSSNFPKDKRWGFFPGASVAWRVSEERFIKDNLDVVDDLKLRASYGQIGNDQVSAFQWLSTYSLGNTGYPFGRSPVTSLGLTAGVTPNPNITWEVAEIMNVGLDGILGKGLLGFTLDFFKQRRSNILAKRDLAIPFNTGLTLPNENIGVVENKGVEIELTHSKNVDDLSYRIAGNVAYAKNKVIDISEPQNVPEWQKAEGHVIGADRFYRALGVIRTQEELESIPIVQGSKVGDLKYEDLDGDGRITEADMVRLDKTNTPELTFGLNLSVSYKQFALWANFAGQAKAWQYYHKYSKEGGHNSLKELLENRYTVGSMDSKYPIIPSSESEVQDVSGFHSDFWLMDATFVRLKTLQLSYSLPQDLLAKAKIRSVMIFVNGNNLFTADKLKWYDPEGNSTTGAFYPQSKIYNLGINLTF